MMTYLLYCYVFPNKCLKGLRLVGSFLFNDNFVNSIAQQKPDEHIVLKFLTLTASWPVHSGWKHFGGFQVSDEFNL